MKNEFFLATIASILSISLFSCAEAQKPVPEPPDPTPIPHPEPDPEPDPEPEPDEFEGYEIKNEDAVRPTTGVEPFYIYGINDFHGAIKEDGFQMGLGYLGSFMKEKTSEQNSLFIDSGDTWQGSLESNFNRGKLINEVFENANLSVRTCGNHDFDWGLEAFENNVKSTAFPNLAANVYDYTWDSKTVGQNQQKQLGKSYATYVLDNGLKVGIIGTIGEDQITSISTQLVQNITFTDQNEKIKEVSDFLRTKKNCDVIIASTHASFDQMNCDAITEVSRVSNKRYVDFVLNAHTHQQENFKINDVCFAQFGAYGQVIGQATLYYDFEDNQLIDSFTSVKSYSSSMVKEELSYKIDDEIKTIIDKYDKDTKDLGSQVLSRNFSGPFYSSEQLPNLMAEAIYEEAKNEGFTVDFAFTNSARASHYDTAMNYSDLYSIFPFDNYIPIIKVRGKQSCNMLRFRNNIYKADPNISINYNDTYTVACIDYVAFHCNSERDYDNFPGFEVVDYLKKDGEIYTYRNILKDYLLNNPEKTFNSSYYSFDNPIFSR